MQVPTPAAKYLGSWYVPLKASIGSFKDQNVYIYVNLR